MLRRTKAALAVTGALALAGLGAVAQPALAAGYAPAWQGDAGRAIERKVDDAAARCAYADANGDGVCDSRGTGARGTCGAYADADGDGVCDSCASAGCGAYADANGDGVCDSRGDGTCATGGACDGTGPRRDGTGAGQGHHAGRGSGHHGGRGRC